MSQCSKEVSQCSKERLNPKRANRSDQSQSTGITPLDKNGPLKKTHPDRNQSRQIVPSVRWQSQGTSPKLCQFLSQLPEVAQPHSSKSKQRTPSDHGQCHRNTSGDQRQPRRKAPANQGCCRENLTSFHGEHQQSTSPCSLPSACTRSKNCTFLSTDPSTQRTQTTQSQMHTPLAADCAVKLVGQDSAPGYNMQCDSDDSIKHVVASGQPERSERSGMQSTVLSNEAWCQFWGQPNPGFHKPSVNPTLKKHLSQLLGGRANLRILVPLCGKSWDMKWLAEQGHRVVGVEVAPKPVEMFFTEQKVPYTTTPVPQLGGTLYQSKDKKILVYCCDFFKVSPETLGQFDAIWDRAAMCLCCLVCVVRETLGQFDAIWDRAAMCLCCLVCVVRETLGQFDAIWDRAAMDALNRTDRQKYGEVLLSLMAPGCRCLMAALQYDETKHPEKGCVVKLVGSEDASGDILESWKFDKMTERIFLITPK
ncbi:hypothetical protein ACOMHN_036425 [Nucella lapillus]